jgi:hypothetical protein
VANAPPRPQLFEPALRQFRSAFRAGDPSFEDEDTARRWAAAKRRATDHVLRAIAESLHGDSLVLRGSRLMEAWFPDKAREPGDLDWVAAPAGLRLTDPHAGRLFDGLMAAIFARPAPADVEFLRSTVAVDDIWTYERAPGRRLNLPWRGQELPDGSVQVDVVFGEELTEPPAQTAIRAADGGCVVVRAAGPAQSLAWKLLWLSTDMSPQGKDLYDAVLLAERFTLDRTVLEHTFRQAAADTPTETLAEFLRGWDVDWANFRAEYPTIDGDASDWLERLRTALGPTFGESRIAGAPPASQAEVTANSRDIQRSPGAYAADCSWLTSTVIALAKWIDETQTFDQLPILADALEESGCADTELLSHLREPGPHTRGCWAVDLILHSR